MPKTHRGLAIDDILFVDKTIVLTFLDFPDSDEAHQSSAIDDLFMSFVNCLYFLPFADAEGDQLYFETLCE
jgi:hypothetical protein